MDEMIRTGGDVDRALEVAEYSPASKYSVIDATAEELLDRAQKYLASHAIRAANQLVDTMGDESLIPKADVRAKAAESILDRVGLGKSEKVQAEIQINHGVVLLPNKEEPKDVTPS